MSGTGLGFGVVDGNRLTLDNPPCWGDPTNLDDRGFFDGARLERELEPRHEALLLVRAEPEQPAIVFTTFHLMGSAVEVHDEAFAADELTANVDSVAGYAQQIFVATAGRDVADVQVVDAASVALTVSFE